MLKQIFSACKRGEIFYRIFWTLLGSDAETLLWFDGMQMFEKIKIKMNPSNC